MHKNYVNLENFNHKLVKIFLEDGKMGSPILREWQDGIEHMVAPSWWQHFL
jgi:hypothetical protein